MNAHQRRKYLRANPHPCQYAPRRFDHDMRYMEDWYGDPDVINGTCTERFYRCSVCGCEEAAEFGDYGPCDDYYDYEYD